MCAHQINLDSFFCFVLHLVVLKMSSGFVGDSNRRPVFFVLRPTLVFCRIWIFSEDAKLEQVFCVACIQTYNILVHEQKYRYIIAYIHVCSFVLHLPLEHLQDKDYVYTTWHCNHLMTTNELYALINNYNHSLTCGHSGALGLVV